MFVKHLSCHLTPLDETYGGLWAPLRFQLMRRTGLTLGVLYCAGKSSGWFGQAGNGWMIYGFFAKAGDMGSVSVSSRKGRLK